MTISDIKFRKSLTDETLKAVASLTIDGCIAIHELKVIQTDHLFVAMPSRKDEFGNYHDIVHPINESARNLIETAVLSSYRIYAESQALIADININND
ncbi:MAG: SpoVG family protein [Oscillospiraceae bacterium]|nr:SpoVG family protein [Oscillospiraceae bacterium]